MPPTHILATRILALDIGDRRIGLAITDALGLTAQPLFTIHRATPRANVRADLKSIARFIRQHKVDTLLVGNPLHADGTPSAQSAKTLAFAELLREQHPTLAFHLLDERHTTQEAHARLNASHRDEPSTAHAKRTARRELIDQVAATVLLESYLAASSPTLLPDPDLV
jgi:putative Holliday junction resolvase